MQSNPTDVRPAASLIVAREGEGGAPQFLMIERAASMSFAGGAMVFPGGGVDEADRAWAASFGSGEMDDFAARIAAVRETIEETGFVPVSQGSVDFEEKAAALRRALLSGRSLADAAADFSFGFDFQALVPFARWCPPAGAASRRYDTRFYIAIAGGRDHLLNPDGAETVALGWHSAHEALDRARQGHATIIFPSRRNLERLAQFDSVAALLDHVRAQPITLISPWVENRDGIDHLCIPEGLGYPVTSEPLATALRS